MENEDGENDVEKRKMENKGKREEEEGDEEEE